MDIKKEIAVDILYNKKIGYIIHGITQIKNTVIGTQLYPSQILNSDTDYEKLAEVVEYELNRSKQSDWVD